MSQPVLMHNNSSQISDITQEGESSTSSSEDEALEGIKEVPFEDDKIDHNGHLNFLEDASTFNRDSNNPKIKFSSNIKLRPQEKTANVNYLSLQPIKGAKNNSKSDLPLFKKETPNTLDVSGVSSDLKKPIKTDEEDSSSSSSEEEEEKMNDKIRAKKIVRDVFPTFLFSVVQLFQETVALQFIGHYCTSVEFAAVALGNLWVNVTGYVMIYGFTTALATLSSHESGKGNSKKIGIQLHQCIFFTIILSVIAMLLNFYVDEILVFTGQPVNVAKTVPLYTWPIVFSFIPYAILSSTVNYLEAQHIYDPASYSTILSFPFHPLICWLLIGVLDMGVFGAGLALCIVQYIDLILLVLLIRFRPIYWDEVKDSLFRPSKESFHGCGLVLKVGFSALILTCIEWLAIEYTTMLAGWCGEAKLSAHTICVQIVNILAMVSSSFGTIIQTYLGYALGKFNRKEFISICRLGPLMGFGTAGTFMILIIVLRGQVARLFTSDQEILDIAEMLLLSSIAYGVFESVQCLLGSIMKGIGKYNVAIWSSIFPYYFVGIPLSYYLTFKYKEEDSIKGVWSGILIGVVLINIIYVGVLFNTNVKREMDLFKEGRRDSEPILSANSSINHIDLIDAFMEKKKKTFYPGVIPRNKTTYRQRIIGR